MSEQKTVIYGRTFEQYAEKVRQDIESQIQGMRDELPKQIEKVRLGYEAVEKLIRAGITIGSMNPRYITVHCEAEDLPRIYQAIGRIRMTCKSVEDAEKGTVCVTLTSEKYPVCICYVKKIDPEKSRCKIVRKAVIETQLVCDL